MMVGAMTAATPGVGVLSQLYGFAGNAATFALEHVETLKAADNVLANRCGQVLEAASIGFGVGAETALVLIGVGQSLLGNPLTTGAIVTGPGNPIVMTCAAIGAIHYGWKALSDKERDVLLGTVGTAFNVGVEFVRSIASFALDLIQTLMSRENMEELKRMVAVAAETFGRHLSDITRLLSDRLREGARLVYSTANGAATTAWAHVPSLRRAGANVTPDEQRPGEQ